MGGRGRLARALARATEVLVLADGEPVLPPGRERYPARLGWAWCGDGRVVLVGGRTVCDLLGVGSVRSGPLGHTLRGVREVRVLGLDATFAQRSQDVDVRIVTGGRAARDEATPLGAPIDAGIEPGAPVTISVDGDESTTAVVAVGATPAVVTVLLADDRLLVADPGASGTEDGTLTLDAVVSGPVGPPRRGAVTVRAAGPRGA